MTMTDVRYPYPRVPASWPAAGIVDARIFTVGASTIIHELTHASSNLVRGACGIVAPIVETDRPRATWAAGYDDGQPRCATCRERS